MLTYKVNLCIIIMNILMLSNVAYTLLALQALLYVQRGHQVTHYDAV